MVLDRYLLAEMSKRLGIALSVVLVSLVIERLVRLFDLVTMRGGPLSMVWEMALMLVPHYLGLALPAGFFISIFLVVARFGEDNEFDAMLSSGVSPRRFALPFIGTGLALMVLSLALFGYAQPYSRYAYRAIYYLATNIQWAAALPEQSFAKVEDATITADRVSANGRELKGVFVHLREGPREVITSAASGQLLFNPARTHYRLMLFDGVQMVVGQSGAVSSIRFNQLVLQRDFLTSLPLFRARGKDVRELSLGELVAERRMSGGALPAGEVAAELHGRLARAASLMFLPFLAIPMGLAAKRSRRGAGLVVGGGALVVYHFALQTVEGLMDMGRLPAAGIWATTALFAALSLALFWRAQTKPGENPLIGMLTGIEHALHLLRRRP